jgi:hypothetical protein
MKKKPLLARPSPSGAHRWIKCPGSLQACYGKEDLETVNEYALDGTTAHRLLEICGRYDHDPLQLVGKIDPETKREITPEIADAVKMTLTWINDWASQRKDVELLREHPVTIELGPYTITGTADVLAYAPRTKELVSLDYKNGVGHWVDAIENYQIALYTLGAVREYPEAKRMTGIVAQPRAVRGDTPLIREWPIRWHRLNKIKAEAIEALHIAHQPNAPRSAGPHCKFCAAAATCRELAEHNLRNAVLDFEDISKRPLVEPHDPQTLTADGLAFCLSQVFVIEGWLRAVEAEAVKRLMAQQPVPGYKLTQGRSLRTWINENKVINLLRKEGTREEAIFKTELRGPAQIEKVVKDKPKLAKRIAALITKRPGAPHVAPENDPRPALAGRAAFDFKPIPREDS